MIAHGLRWLANRIDPPAHARFNRGLTVPRDAFADAELDKERRDHALALMDPDTFGFVAAVVKDKGGFATVEVTAAVHDDHWPAVKATLAHVVVEADRVYRP